MGGSRDPNELSSRELEVLRLVAAGLSTKQIAVSLGIAFKTAACHRSHIMDKLGIHDIAGLTRYAVGKGYIQASTLIPSSQKQEQLFEQVRLTYRRYKQSLDENSAFHRGESKSIGTENPDSATRASQLQQAEQMAYHEYYSALLALRSFLIPPLNRRD